MHKFLIKKMPVDLFETSLKKQINYPTKTENDNRYVNLTGDEMVGDLNMNNKNIKNLANPTSSLDATNKEYVDLKVSNPGDIKLNNNKLYFDTNKQYSISLHTNILGLDLAGVFVIRNAGTNDYILFIDKFQIHCYDKPLKNIADPTDTKDAANKKYVDLSLEKAKDYTNSKIISNPYAPGAERYFDYLFIKETYKPTFWISGYYNSGLQIINENEYTRLNEVNELTGSGYLTKGIFRYDNNLKAFRFTPSNVFSIISRTNYSTHYTFFVIMSQDDGASGRLFTSVIGNRLFGFWKLRYGSIWIDEDINVDGKGNNDGSRYIFTLRNNNDLKTAFINNEQYHESSAGANDWGKVVLGAPISIINEGGKGYIYEAICFNKALNNAQITSIYKKLIKYYPKKIKHGYTIYS